MASAKIVTEYKNATKDLMLTYIEHSHAYTNDFGDVDESFYNNLLNIFKRFTIELKMSPAKHEVYAFEYPLGLRLRLDGI